MNIKINNTKIKKIKKKDINIFKKFVSDNYKKKHILSSNSSIVNFYYNFYNLKNTNLIGLYKKKNLLAVIGVIPNKNWDRKLNKDYFIALLVKKRIKNLNTLPLLKYIYKNIKPNFLATNGINLKTSGVIFKNISNINNYQHFYILNPSIKKKISKNLKNAKISSKKFNLILDISTKINKMPKSNYFPKKSNKFFNNKYFCNPFYDYFSMNFFFKNKLCFFFICRTIFVKKLNAKVIRVVDFFGSIPKNSSIIDSVVNYLIENKIEYIDFLCAGISENLLIDLGFCKKKKSQLIPNHFEPLKLKESNLNYSIMLNSYIAKKTILVKGDGDQDRPNII
jgi:hypothetical protein